MELIEAIKSRKSIRGFKPTLVPSKVLTEIIDLARLSPSGINLQPWEFIVLTGESLQKANRVNEEQVALGAKGNADAPGYQINGPYRERQFALGQKLYGLLDISRDDAKKRAEWGLKGMRFYDAPAAILVCSDEMIYNSQSRMPLVDIGIVAQSIALIALEYGLGTCIEGAPVFYPAALKKALGIPESKRPILGIAIGYPDWDSPVNQLQSGREPLDSLISWKS
ncbi:MAG: nitroreductase [Dehalococcoidia bacterium]